MQATLEKSDEQPLENIPFESLIAEYRPFLLRLARSQLAGTSAEDAVQETLLAAWRGGEKFRGASAIRTWLVGILRFKIID